MAKKGFWDRFADKMEKFGEDMAEMADQLADYDSDADNVTEVKSGNNSVTVIGKGNKITTSKSQTIRQFGIGKSVSNSVIVQGGKKVEVQTKDGKTTIKVDGKEYVEKEKK